MIPSIVGRHEETYQVQCMVNGKKFSPRHREAAVYQRREISQAIIFFENKKGKSSILLKFQQLNLWVTLGQEKQMSEDIFNVLRQRGAKLNSLPAWTIFLPDWQKQRL